MRSMGIDATLVVLKRDATIAKAIEEWLEGIPVVFIDDRIPRLLRTSRKVPGFYFFSFFHLIYALVLPFRVRRREWDVILSHNSYTTFTAWTLSMFRRIPYWMFVWDPISAVLVRAYTKGPIGVMRPLLLPLGRVADRVVARRAEGVIVGSGSYLSYLGSLMRPSKPITVIPPGCVPAVTPRASVGEYLLSATSWKEGKQLEVLLHAVARLPLTPVVVAGRWLHPDYRTRIDGVIAELGLAGQVRITGEVTEAEMAELAARARCAATMNAELGFGMPALEAAAQGCTFVCPNVAGVTAYFEDGVEAFYFEEGNSSQLADVLRPLMSDRELALRAGRAAWEKARSSLTWADHASAVAAALGITPVRA